MKKELYHLSNITESGRSIDPYFIKSVVRAFKAAGATGFNPDASLLADMIQSSWDAVQEYK